MSSVNIGIVIQWVIFFNCFVLEKCILPYCGRRAYCVTVLTLRQLDHCLASSSHLFRQPTSGVPRQWLCQTRIERREPRKSSAATKVEHCYHLCFRPVPFFLSVEKSVIEYRLFGLVWHRCIELFPTELEIGVRVGIDIDLICIKFWQFLLLLQFTHISTWGSIACWFIFLTIYPFFWPAINLAPEMVGMVRFSSVVVVCIYYLVPLRLFPICSHNICYIAKYVFAR